MDLPRPALLKQIQIRLSAEGRGVIYLAQDQANGKIFALPAALAVILRQMKAAALGDTKAREDIQNEDAREAFKFLHMIQSMRDVDTIKRKPINPIFANIPLFDVGSWQAGLEGLADRLVTKGYFVFMLCLAVFVVFLGIRNDWSILGVFENVFSIEALVTFGVMAPFLKLIHEFGHVLVATKARVRVRKAGLYLIGLYPMPYVDCTEADMTAKRVDRISISLAGLFVDVTIGLSACIAWYLIDGNYLRTLLGNIFMYSTLNSVLFNANPLIKLDGYYALTDAIGARNLYTRASKTLQDLRLYIMTLGTAGGRPVHGRQWGLIAYAVLAFIYRLNILFVIASALIPKYLGVGAAVTVWGGIVMFLAPMMQDRPPSQPKARNVKTRLYVMRTFVVAGLILALLFVKLPFRTTVSVTLDVASRYQVTTASRGYVVAPPSSGVTDAGAVLLQLGNPALRDRLILAMTDLAGSNLAYETVRGDDPAKAQAAQQAVATNEDQVVILETQNAGLALQAPRDGLFVPHRQLPVGTFLDSGSAIGAFFPDEGIAQFSGAFDERYYDKFQAGPDMITLRMAGSYYDLAIDDVRLQSTVTLDSQSGVRSYTLKASYAQAPSEIAHLPATIRVRFPPAPLWMHAQFMGQKIVANFRESQLLDRQKLLEN